MIISHFNRYFEKHGRKTYIVLGIIISLMFVVFISGGAGDIFSFLGSRQLGSWGTMYGKSLKGEKMSQKMLETSMAISLTNPYQEQLNDTALLLETLHRMRMLREAHARGLDKVTDEEVAEKIQNVFFFLGDDGKFDIERFQRFKGTLDGYNLSVNDFDRIMKESLIIERLEADVTKDVTVDEAEVNSYVEKYTARYAVFPTQPEDGRPTEAEIADFFAKRAAELKLSDSRSAIVAQFSVSALLENVPAELAGQIEPPAEEISTQYEKYRETIRTMLRSRNARAYLEKQAKELSEKFQGVVENETELDRQRRFMSEAGKAGASLTTTGYVTGTAAVPGIGENEMSLAERIRGLETVGQVSQAAYMVRGPAIAYLRERKATALPTELDDELRAMIAEKLIEEKAIAMYQEKVQPFGDALAKSGNFNSLLQEEYNRLQKADMTQEDIQLGMYEYQRGIQDNVMPFFERERRAFTAALFPYAAYEAGVAVDDAALKAAYEERSAEYQRTEYRLARIQFHTHDLDEAAAAAKRAELDALLAQVADGADFEALAMSVGGDGESVGKDFVTADSLPA